MSLDIHPPHRFADLSDLLNGQGLPLPVAPGALDHHAGDLRIRCGTGDPLQIRAAVRQQVHLGIIDAIKLQGAEAVSADADGAAQCVIGGPRHRQYRLARLGESKHGRRQGVGPVHKADAHQCRLGPEKLGVDLIQRVSSQIVIAISGGPGKAAVGNALILEGLHHPPGVDLRHPVDLPKPVSAGVLRQFCHFSHFRLNVRYLHLYSISITIFLKVLPRTSKFLKASKEAQAGERSTVSPSSARFEAARTASRKSFTIVTGTSRF